MSGVQRYLLCAACFTGAAVVAAGVIVSLLSLSQLLPYLTFSVAVTALLAMRTTQKINPNSPSSHIVGEGTFLPIVVTFCTVLVFLVSSLLGTPGKLGPTNYASQSGVFLFAFLSYSLMALIATGWITIPLGIAAAFLYRGLLRRFSLPTTPKGARDAAH